MNTFERYIWLVDTLRRNERLSYDEIASRWEKASQNDEHLPLEKRSFLNHIKAIEAQMGISIVCDRRDGYRYHIKEDNEQDGVKGWLMESVAVSNTISESRDLAGRIMLEQIPSGHQHLETIINAMHTGTVVSIFHKSYWRTEPTMREVRPYGLRLADRRWYLIGYVDDYEDVRVYGLDRIIDIDITERKFDFPEDFDLKSYFKGCSGVVKGGDIKTVRIKVTKNQQKYVDSLPLHESQRMIERNDEKDYAIFEYYVRPTIEFTMKILSYGASIEVLEPMEYRNEIADIASKMKDVYNRSITKDTNQLCTEVVAEYLLDNIDSLMSIPVVRRELRYRIDAHQSRTVPVGSNRKEEAIAIGLLRESLDNGKIYDFGKVFDYQIPLKAKQSDHYGKIDIVSESGNDVFLLELKKPDSSETMLKCVLESFTYSRQLDKDKFLNEYGMSCEKRIVPAPLVYKNSRQHEDCISEEQPFLKELIDRLSIKVFFL